MSYWDTADSNSLLFSSVPPLKEPKESPCLKNATFYYQSISGRASDKLVEILKRSNKSIELLDEIVHCIGKIGGQKAFDALTDVLVSDNMHHSLKAKALHAPGRFWEAHEYNRFVEAATPIIERWPIDLCKSVQESNIFRYIHPPLSDIVKACAKK